MERGDAAAMGARRGRVATRNWNGHFSFFLSVEPRPGQETLKSQEKKSQEQKKRQQR